MAGDVYLKIEKIGGESKDKKHEKWIEIMSWNFSCNHQLEVRSSGAVHTGKPYVSGIAFSKMMDIASNKLWQACVTGEDIGKIQLELCRTSGAKEAFYTIELEGGVYVSSFSISGAGEPSENVTLEYAKITTTYHGQAVKGGGKAGNLPAHYDRSTNV